MRNKHESGGAQNNDLSNNNEPVHGAAGELLKRLRDSYNSGRLTEFYQGVEEPKDRWYPPRTEQGNDRLALLSDELFTDDQQKLLIFLKGAIECAQREIDPSQPYDEAAALQDCKATMEGMSQLEAEKWQRALEKLAAKYCHEYVAGAMLGEMSPYAPN